MNKVRIGVIGCASKIAKEYHLPALKKVDGVVWKYACDIQKEEAEKIAQEYGFEKVTDNYWDVLNDPEIDAVVILTRVDSHAEISIAAAKAKKQIFMQKSIAYSLEDAQRILDAVKKNEVKMTISFMHRYFDECIEAAKIIQSGRLGNIRTVRIRNCTKNPTDTVELYGGSLMDIGGHGIDLAQALFNQEILRVRTLQLGDNSTKKYGWDTNLSGNDLDAILLYELADSTQVIHEVVWSHVSKVDRFDVEVSGCKGTLYIRKEFSNKPLLLAIAENGAENEIDWSIPSYTETFFGELQHRLFIEDIIKSEKKSLTAEDGFKVLAVVEAAARSFESGNWEEPLSPKYKI